MQRTLVACLTAASLLALSMSARGGPVAAAGTARALTSCSVATAPDHTIAALPSPTCLGPAPRLSAAARARLAHDLQLDAKPNIANTGGRWDDLGPSPVNFGSTATPALDSGRIISMVYDTPLSTLFIGAANGGVWRSVSPFTSWTPLTDGMPDLAIGALAVDPTDSTGNTIYAGTGESNASGDSKYGAGIYKTINGGGTWTQLGAATFGFATISSIVVDPVTGDVYASVESAFGGGGLFMSTNGGGSWTNNSNLSGDSIGNLQIDSLGDVYAAVGANTNTQTDNGVWECPAGCAAQLTPTFTKISTGLPTTGDRFKLALADPSDAPGSQTLYVIISDGSNNSGSPPSYDNVLGLYRATSAGNIVSPASWTQIGSVSSFDSYEGQAWYNMAIYAPDPADVYVSLENIYKVTGANTGTPAFTDLTCVYGSGVGGTNPNHCAGTTVGVHTDQHAIAPGPSGITFFGNDGGAWDTTDGGATWNDLNGNLSTMQLYAGSVGTKSTGAGGPCTGAYCDNTLTLGGMQDNGTAESNSTIGSQWHEVFGGDGFYTAIDPTNNNNQFEEYTEGQINITNDNWTSTPTSATPTTCGAGTPATNFGAPMLEDPANPGTLLSGDRNLCESTNAESATPTWTNISGGVNSTAVSAIALSHAGAATVIYFSDNGGNSWYSDDNGVDWHSMNATSCATASSGPNCAVLAATSAGMSPTSCFCVTASGLAADPNTKGLIYAVVNAFQSGSAGHVFRGQVDFTTHAVTWTDISGNLPNVPLYTVAISPQNSNIVYVGGGPGVYVTGDAQATTPTWVQEGSGLPNADVYNLQISADGSRLVAFTHGRSAWQYAGNPTAVGYSHLVLRRADGWTVVTWKSTSRVAGFDVYSGSHRLNRRLVTSRTLHYRFRVHKLVGKVRLMEVPFR